MEKNKFLAMVVSTKWVKSRRRGKKKKKEDTTGSTRKPPGPTFITLVVVGPNKDKRLSALMLC